MLVLSWVIYLDIYRQKSNWIFLSGTIFNSLRSNKIELSVCVEQNLRKI